MAGLFENQGGSLYTLDEFIARIFDDLEWEDLPLPVSNEKFMEHFNRSVIKPFSQFCPQQVKIRFGDEALITPEGSIGNYRRYRLPMYRFPTQTCLGVSLVEPISNLAYSNEWNSVPFMAAPDALLMAMSDIRMYSAIGANTGRSLTTAFHKPDVLDLYGGYLGCTYEATILLSHDLSLSTIPDTAFEQLYELALLDTKAYFFSKLKRKDGLDTTVGTIQLKIEDWADAARERTELLKRWQDEGFNLDIDSAHYFN